MFLKTMCLKTLFLKTLFKTKKNIVFVFNVFKIIVF